MTLTDEATRTPFTHGKCGKRWGGMNTAHCAGCCTTYTGIAAFEKHRNGGKCSSPADVGLVQAGRNYECFGEPSDGTEWWKVLG